MRAKLLPVTASMVLLGIGVPGYAGGAADLVSHDLVPFRTCLAGDWGRSRTQWRIQFGFFHRYAGAARLQKQLARRGILADPMIAAWDPREPLAVVSHRSFRTSAAARAAAARYRRAGLAALPRRYRVFSRR